MKMNDIHYLQGNDFENRRQELFNRIVDLSIKVSTFKGIVQNPLPGKMSEFNDEAYEYITTELFNTTKNINQWHQDLASFLTDFYNEHKG